MDARNRDTGSHSAFRGMGVVSTQGRTENALWTPYKAFVRRFGYCSFEPETGATMPGNNTGKHQLNRLFRPGRTDLQGGENSTSIRPGQSLARLTCQGAVGGDRGMV
jgi:hypothetical protein